MRKTVIVGYAGQDGTILKEILVNRGDSVIGIGEKTISCHECETQLSPIDIDNFSEVCRLIMQYQPAEVYHLAAYHHSAQDRIPDEYTTFHNSFRTNTFSLFNFLEAISLYSPLTRLFYAASSHIFGEPSGPDGQMQDESTPINPTCLYGISKAAGLLLCRYYRKNHGIFASAGILYNHESKYRGTSFLSKKIVQSAVSIRKQGRGQLVLGDLTTSVDWGYAPDYVLAFTKILAADKADDYVIASGQKHSILQFVETVFQCLGLDWRQHVVADPSLIQKSRRCLVGNSSLLKRKTGWRVSKDFESMIKQLLRDEGAFDD